MEIHLLLSIAVLHHVLGDRQGEGWSCGDEADVLERGMEIDRAQSARQELAWVGHHSEAVFVLGVPAAVERLVNSCQL